MTVREDVIEVLHAEAAGIEDLAARIDDNTAAAVELMSGVRGRVVVTGMGKSGHIAHKVAATLASTGTPAFWLHPAEGIHGDLGMVTADDAVMAFSNSGETAEVLAILPSLRRIGAKLIAVVGKVDSTLARMADVTLDVGVEHEACPLDMAPTTSTTVALALGDALAVALMKLHGFTAEHFAVFHPGGALGRKLLLTVDQVMHGGEDNPIVAASATVQDALFVMTEKGLGATNVVDADGRLIGLVTDGDIRRALNRGPELLLRKVESMMTASPQVIGPQQLAAEALHMMEQHHPRPITVLPVVDENRRAVGMLHITDLLRRGIV